MSGGSNRSRVQPHTLHASAGLGGGCAAMCFWRSVACALNMLSLCSRSSSRLKASSNEVPVFCAWRAGVADAGQLVRASFDVF